HRHLRHRRSERERLMSEIDPSGIARRPLWILMAAPPLLGIALGGSQYLIGTGSAPEQWKDFAEAFFGWAIWSPLAYGIMRTPLIGEGTARRTSVLRIALTWLAALGVERLLLTFMHLAIWHVTTQTMADMLSDAFLAAALVFFSAAVQYRSRNLIRETESAILERRMAEVRLQYLLAQLTPHFLFNTLNGVLALLEDDRPAAGAMVDDLATFVEMVIVQEGAVTTTVRQEMHILGSYVSLQQRRFPEALHFHAVVDPGTLDAELPSLLLQPLIENAMRHGMAEGSQCAVHVEVRERHGRLCIEVEDSGEAFSGSFTEGIGLSNTRLRLQAIYQDDYEFRMKSSPTGGARVEISIPCAPPPRPSLP
ncbi:MAG: yehU 2, partial [Acidobacteria bacterium]|nr:yehU 2 [Acidobacteriota bacterium]